MHVALLVVGSVGSCRWASDCDASGCVAVFRQVGVLILSLIIRASTVVVSFVPILGIAGRLGITG